VGTSPLVFKRFVEKSRVENTYRSLLAQRCTWPIKPPKRRNSPAAAVAVAVVVSVREDRGNGNGDGPDWGAYADHLQTGCGCWADCEGSSLAAEGLKGSFFREKKGMLLDQMVVVK
jgi:hypothetical protein